MKNYLLTFAHRLQNDDETLPIAYDDETQPTPYETYGNDYLHAPAPDGHCLCELARMDATADSCRMEMGHHWHRYAMLPPLVL